MIKSITIIILLLLSSQLISQKEKFDFIELETDKVNVEVPSPAEGILSEINFKNGDTVEVGALLGTISSEDENVVPITKSKKQEKSEGHFSNPLFLRYQLCDMFFT